jgi:hypothetical protein
MGGTNTTASPGRANIEPPESPSVSEFQELDSEIQRMSLDADAILESIRTAAMSPPSSPQKANVTTEQVSSIGQMTTSRTTQMVAPLLHDDYKYDDEYDEDDDMNEEMGRLESITASIRQSLDEDDVPIMQPSRAHLETDVKKLDTLERDATDILDAKKGEQLRGNATNLSEVLLLSCTLVWVAVGILILQGRYFLLDADGNIQLPFGMFKEPLPIPEY